jgi:fructosamine-3-kinase
VSVSSLLLDRLHQAGFGDVAAVEPVSGGMAAFAGVGRRRSGPPFFVKSFAGVPPDGLFAAEAEGLEVLRERGAGGRQDNTWDSDGHAFFARSRLLRWLPEPRVRAALDDRDRRALERLCDLLPDVLPPRPACLTHGDLWAQNILATRDGQPALIDPAVSYMWAEVDLAHLWCTPHPPEAQRFFAVYAELTGLDDDWPARMPIIQLRQHLAVVAQHDHDWGAADQVRATLEPFRRR